MTGWKRVLPLSVFLLSAPFAAQATEATYAFESVTGIEYVTPIGANVLLTGVLVGTSAPTTLDLSGMSVSERCISLVETMLGNPGLYTLTLVLDTQPNSWPPPATVTYLTRCRLNLVP